LIAEAVKVSLVAPFVILKVPAGIPAVAVNVAVRLAAVVGAAPAKLVLKTTKSFAQLGPADTSNVNFAGYCPIPTLPPASNDMPQSPDP
jgi:hypothetical protein